MHRLITTSIISFVIIAMSLPSITSGQQFVDASEAAGLLGDVSKTWGNPLWGDLNNDGYLDLIIPTHGLNTPPRHPYIYINNGNGTFSDVFASSGVRPSDLDTKDWHGYSLGDYDGDGKLDLYIAEGAKKGARMKMDLLFKGEGNGQFRNVTTDAGIDVSANRGRIGFWVDYNNDGLLDLFVKNFEGKNCLYRNNGDGTFTDVAESSGLSKATLGTGEGTNVSWADYDGDGFMDIFITGDNSPDTLLRNNGDGTFTDVSISAGIAPIYGGKGIAWGDYNNDGFLDLYIARGSLGGNVPVTYKNTLYRNNGDGTFTDVTDSAGVAAGTNTWAAVWGDYDNDGYLDLFVTTAGLPIGANNANFLFLNNGDGTFTNLASETGIALADNKTAHKGAAWGDYDNDGFLDLLIKEGAGGEAQTGGLAKGRHRLFRNTGNGNGWLKVALSGVWSNSHGIGAKLILLTPGGLQYRENNGGGGGELYSQGSVPVHFGLGNIRSASLRVVWPSGIIDYVSGIPADSFITITEGTATYKKAMEKQ